jgi:hypothetical protein
VEGFIRFKEPGQVYSAVRAPKYYTGVRRVSYHVTIVLCRYQLKGAMEEGSILLFSVRRCGRVHLLWEESVLSFRWVWFLSLRELSSGVGCDVLMQVGL